MLKKTKGAFYFLPLGGSGEIGMNLNLYGLSETKDDNVQWLIVDCGVTFGAFDNDFGINVSMPDIAFLEHNLDQIAGLVITHAHEDHIGAVSHLWKRLGSPDIYLTKFSASVLERKFDEKNITCHNMHVIKKDDPIPIGNFTINFFELTHSIVESNAVFIHTSMGTVMHTGDFKVDPKPMLGSTIDFQSLEQKVKESSKITAMVCDSTNVMSEGHSGSEQEVFDSLLSLIKGIKGAIAVTTFASNIARLKSIANIAHMCRRKLVLAGRSMYRMIEIAQETGYFDDENFPKIYAEEDLSSMAAKEVLVLCTGSQGEPKAALSKIASGAHKYVKFGVNDTVIFSSRIIPGNEKSIFSLQNKLVERGIHVITEKDHFVHVSGHPCQEELKTLYDIVQPKTLIPVHGEFRHMDIHTDFAKQCGIPHSVFVKNGYMVQLAPGKPKVVDEVPVGRIHQDGKLLIRDNDSLFKQRKKLAYSGVVVMHIHHTESGDLEYEPDIKMTGVPTVNDAGIAIKDILLDEVYDCWHSLMSSQKKYSSYEKCITDCIKNVFNAQWGKKPFIQIFLSSNSM